MSKEYDPYRDSYLRYMGYANEVGEAFRPLVPRTIVRLSYALATGYVVADTFDKGIKVQQRGGNVQDIAIKSSDVFIWQMFASVFIPGFTINRLTYLTGRLLRLARMNKNIVRTVPTAIGLCSIPLIIHPIDNFVDFCMDNTFRKIFTVPR